MRMIKNKGREKNTKKDNGKVSKGNMKGNAKRAKEMNNKKDVKVERRGEKRIPVELEVKYSTHQGFAIDWITNISKGGMFIKTENPLPVGTQLEIKFSVPEQDEIISAEGEVRWVAPPSHGEFVVPGMGIKITKIDEKSKKFLEEFMEKYGK